MGHKARLLMIRIERGQNPLCLAHWPGHLVAGAESGYPKLLSRAVQDFSLLHSFAMKSVSKLEGRARVTTLVYSNVGLHAVTVPTY